MKHRIIAFSLLACSLMNISCNEDRFLKEVPLDFITVENAYVTYADYQSALTGLYNMVRYYEYTNEGMRCMLGTDVAYNARRNNDRMGNLVNEYKPTTDRIAYHWESYYKLIKNANTINSRVWEADLSASLIMRRFICFMFPLRLAAKGKGEKETFSIKLISVFP